MKLKINNYLIIFLLSSKEVNVICGLRSKRLSLNTNERQFNIHGAVQNDNIDIFEVYSLILASSAGGCMAQDRYSKIFAHTVD